MRRDLPLGLIFSGQELLGCPNEHMHAICFVVSEWKSPGVWPYACGSGDTLQALEECARVRTQPMSFGAEIRAWQSASGRMTIQDDAL